MAAYDNSYSRFVAWMKILLPLVALGILSTIFLLARTIEPSQTIPYTDFDLSALDRDQRIGGPNFAGVTTDGAAITLFAKNAIPDSQNPLIVDVNEMTAQITTTDGNTYDINALKGRIDSSAQIGSLAGDVSLVTSNGYTVKSEEIIVEMDVLKVMISQTITADGPIGNLVAGNMVLEGNQTDGYLLVFNGGVKLIYHPEN